MIRDFTERDSDFILRFFDGLLSVFELGKVLWSLLNSFPLMWTQEGNSTNWKAQSRGRFRLNCVDSRPRQTAGIEQKSALLYYLESTNNLESWTETPQFSFLNECQRENVLSAHKLIDSGKGTQSLWHRYCETVVIKVQRTQYC